MKTFTKLALVSSMALSANAFAMQAMDDSALSATTGQDGLSIGIGISKIEIEKLFIHDNDGLKTANGAGTAGAIVIQGNGKSILDDQGNETNAVKDHGVVIGANYDDNGAYLLASRNLADLTIDSDGGAGGGNTAFINIAAEVSGLDIKIGEIGVTASGVQGSASTTSALRRGGDENNYNAILSGLELKTGKMDANIQLGAAPQGAMVKLKTTMVGGLEIKNLGILDNSTKGVTVGSADLNGTATAVATKEAGEIFIESIKITDANGKDLTLDQNIQVFNNAYVGGSDTVGKAAHIRIVSNDTGFAKDQYIKGIHLGNRDAASIGDMEVQGLQTYYSTSPRDYIKGAVISISGH
ncbi:putative pilus system protein FilA [Acinetobacter indicus]|uniref:putative pilus system protein FilA n=1 Tax=Acinetobacter indicus TaxID=756892 RepID=UPI00398909F9